MPLIEDGRIKPLAVTGAKRSGAVPAVPTVAESAGMVSGLAGFDSSSWQGLFAPARTAGAVVTRIQQATAKALAAADVQQRLKLMGSVGVGTTPAVFAAYYQAEIVKFAKLVRDAKIPKQD